MNCQWKNGFSGPVHTGKKPNQYTNGKKSHVHFVVQQCTLMSVSIQITRCFSSTHSHSIVTMDWCYVQIPETMASDIRQKSADQFQGKERIKQTHSRWWASGNFTIINAKNNLWTFQFQPSQNRKKIKSLINSCFGGGTSNSYIQQILNDPACNQLTKESNVFWILARSVKDFIEQDNDGWSPLAGTIPDMIADTQNYINLQNVYRQKALDDADLV